MIAKRWIGIALLTALLGCLGFGATGSAGSAAWIQRAETLAAAKSYAAAVEAYLAAVPWNPRDPLPYLRCGRIYLKQRRFLLADKALWHAYLLDTRNADTLVALGDLAAAQKMNELAIPWYRQASLSVANPARLKRAEINIALGKALLAESDFPNAMEAFRAALTADTEQREAHYYSGLLLADQEPEVALSHLRAAIGSEEDDLAAKARMMIAELAGLGKSQDAAERAGLLGLAYMRQGAWTLACAQLAQTAALSPDHSEVQAYWGYALYQLEEYSAAEQSLKRAMQLDAQNAQPYHFMGMLYRRLGAPHAALEMLGKAYELDWRSPAIAADIARAYVEAGAYAEAESWFEEVVELAPDNASYILLQAAFHIDHAYHVRDRGIPAAERAIALQPQQAAAHDLLGWGLFLTGDYIQAEETLRRALAINPELASAHYHLAELYARQGKIQAARSAYQRAVDLDETGWIRQRAQQELERLKAGQGS